jgi:PhoPQ-activated pathogenicity-related protein
LNWEFVPQDGKLRLQVRSQPAARQVVAWVATAPTQDFRQATWRSFPTVRDGEQAVYELAEPETGFAAVFAEAEYTGEGLPCYFSTNVRVLAAKR